MTKIRIQNVRNKFRHVFFQLAILAMLIICHSASAKALQSLDVLQAQVEDFIAENTQNVNGKVEFTVKPLDKRLRLPDCSDSLNVFLPSGSRLEGNATLGVKCTNPSKYWTVYISAKLKIYKPVVVAKHPLERGKLISTADLTTQVQEISRLRASYYSEPQQVIGKVTSRRIAIGAALTSSSVKTPPLVKRGEQVTIIANVNALEIRMSGKALANGKAGDVIKVRNSNSNRVVHGKVIKAGVVQVRI